MSGDIRVRVAGDDDGRLAAAVESTGATPISDGDAALTVVDGERALLSLVRDGERGPILAVDAGRGVRSVSANDRETGITAGVEAARDGDLATVERRPLSVEPEDGPAATALFDAGLVTAEAARISEYAIESDGSEVGRFRADGVVVATPAGSHGYAAAAGGPTVSPATDAVVAVPIAPFVTDTTRWVLDGEAVTLSTVRDEGAVTLLCDDEELTTVAPGTLVEIGRAPPVTFAVVERSRSFYDRD